MFMLYIKNGTLRTISYKQKKPNLFENTKLH